MTKVTKVTKAYSQLTRGEEGDLENGVAMIPGVLEGLVCHPGGGVDARFDLRPEGGGGQLEAVLRHGGNCLHLTQSGCPESLGDDVDGLSRQLLPEVVKIALDD